ncbi:hypothetical protein [Corallococcus silvisoli]|uniref:hypothetical protein n=1 Tax=Corallococcus silvisoli TaxID=2697031 RepID=UPI001376999E|nr:hypothetical protein [Corallococcus silvisoli]NBD11834.1 hypothetical protein [Corallococcus silvisoli]
MDDLSALFASPFPNRQEEALALAQALRAQRQGGATPPPLVSLEDDGPARTAALAAALRSSGASVPPGPGAPSDNLDGQRALAAALRGRGQGRQSMDAYRLFAPDAEAPPQVDAYASSVNNQRGAGMLGLLTGDSVLSRVGEAQLRGAGQHESMLAEAGQQNTGNVLKKALADAKAKQDEKEAKFAREKFAEARRHNLAMEARPVPSMLVAGPGGQYFAVNTTSGGPATPITDATGAPIIKPETAKQLSAEEKNALQALSTEVQSIASLGSRFKDEYAGDGPLGNARTAAASVAGAWAPEKEQEIASFWADYASLIDLPQRNKVFGASLSEGEKAAWESAKNIKRSSDPERIRSKFAELTDIANKKLAARREALLAEGYKPEAVNALTSLGGPSRTTPGASMTPDGAGSFTLDSANGQAPAATTSGSTIPILAPSSLKPGEKAVDVMKEGERRRIQMQPGVYRTVVKRNGKLKVED